jgi:flavin reductase ActVB
MLPVTAGTFREAMAHIPTAVSVITTMDASGAPWGVTVGTLGALSTAPPLVMFCLGRGSASHEVLTSSARFLVHVLTDQQADVAACFARRGGHGFGENYSTAYGLPAIPGAMSRLLCVQHALVPGGDHTIVVGDVQGAESGTGAPLLYYEHSYHSLNWRTECPVSHVTAGSMSS